MTNWCIFGNNSQHKGYVRLGDENKAIFLHIKNTNHSIAFQQASVMKYSNTYINRNLIESAVIKVFSDVLLNIRPGLFSLDNYIAQKIVSFNRIC